jgi:N-methylhydantoinase A
MPERHEQATAAETRRVFLDGAERDVPVFARGDLKAGQFFQSPAIVTQSDCTTCIPAGFKARVDTYGNLILTQEA